jgi:hypothetical protein
MRRGKGPRIFEQAGEEGILGMGDFRYLNFWTPQGDLF